VQTSKLTLKHVQTSKILSKTGNFYELTQLINPIYTGTSKPLIPKEKKYSNLNLNPTDLTLKISVSRARAKLRRLVLGNMWSDTRHSMKFITLTFAEEVTNLDDAIYELKKFRQKIGRHINEKLNYIAVPEIQLEREKKTGKAVWHFHLLTLNLPYIQGDALAAIWTNGFVKPKRVNRVNGCTLYLTKYLSKSYQDHRLYNRKRFYNAFEHQTVKYTNEDEIQCLYEQFRPKATKVNEYPIFRLNDQGARVELGIKSEFFVHLL